MTFRFDRFTLNSDTRTLSYKDSVVTLTPKVFQTLLVLVENRHRVMSKAELFERLWPEQTVEEANLTQNISILRKALKETKHGKRFIATFHGHGYRFVEPVTTEEEEPLSSLDMWVDSAPEVPVQERRMAWTGAAAVQPPEPVPAEAEQRQQPRTLDRQGMPLLVLASLLVGIILCYLFLIEKTDGGQKEALAQSSEVTTLVRMEGSQYQPSWSADGKQLAFINVAPDGQSSSIEIQSAADTNPKPVLSAEGMLSSPVWSPDGKSLAFIQAHQGTAEIRILSLWNGSTRRLATLSPHRYALNFRHMDWSPDGNLLVVDDKVVETDPLSLYLVNVNDGSKLRLTYADMDMIGDIAPRFSPDGSHVAFIRARYQFQNGVFVVPVSGGKAREVTNEESRLGDVDWQTNDLLVFSGRFDDQFRFWRSDLRKAKSNVTQLLPFGSDLPAQISIARGSGQMAFSTHGPDLDIWSLDLTRGISAASTWNLVIRTPGQDVEPLVSPDGAKLAFRSDSSGKMQIWVSLRDGTEKRRIDTGKLVPSVYCWTSDSDALIFSARYVSGLYEASLSGTPVKQLTRLPLSHPACSPDGSSVYAIDNNFVYRLNLADGAVTKISDNGGAPIAQSRDGRYIYLAHGRMDSTISQRDLKTGKQTIVIHTLAPGYSESWALTSQGILFLAMENGNAVVMFHDLATGQERPASSFAGNLPPVGLSQFSVSPNEKKLYVVRADPVFSNIESTNLN